MNNFFDEQLKTPKDTKSQPDVETLEPLPGENDEDDTYVPQVIKNAIQELMKYGLLEMERKPKLYQAAQIHQSQINQTLSILDLRLKIDDIRGLAFLVVPEKIFADAEDGEWSHPLIRRQRLTLEQTLLIAILRQYYVAHEQEAGAGAGGAIVDLDELRPQLFTYLGESGSEAKDKARLAKLLDQLHSHGIVSELDDKEQLTIRPIITHLANPETLQLLLQHFQQLAAENQKSHE